MAATPGLDSSKLRIELRRPGGEEMWSVVCGGAIGAVPVTGGGRGAPRLTMWLRIPDSDSSGICIEYASLGLAFR